MRILWLCLVVLCTLPGGAMAAPAATTHMPDPTAITVSNWQVSKPDSASSTRRNVDDQGWSPFADVTFTPGHLPDGDMRWFRADFILGWHYKTRDLAISLGALRGADVVYVNDRLIGESGAFEGPFWSPAGQTRVYRLPKNRLWFSFLDFERSNQLLIGIRSDVEPIRIDVDKVEIGDYEVLALKARDADTSIKIIQGAAVTLLLLLSLFSLFLRLNGYRSLTNNLFGLCSLVLASSIAATSLLLNDLGVQGNRLRLGGLGLDFLSLVVFVRFVRNEVSIQSTRPYRILERLGYAVLALVLIAPLLDDRFGPWLEYALKWSMVLLALAGLVNCIRLLHKGEDIDLYMLIALLAVVIGAFMNIVWVGNHWPLTPYHCAVTFAAVFLLYDVARNFQTMSLSMQSLSSRLVSIREKERRRLTRDIHDGVGQGLSTLKLFITLNKNKLEPELGAMLKEEVDRTSETLKSVIRNLKPIEVDNGSPIDALIELARHLCTIAGIVLEVTSADDVRLNPETAYQIYRIGQEALNNALKHSGGNRIRIGFVNTGKRFVLSIADNGRGIPLKGVGEGYGLSSMRERALIVGGDLRILQAPGGGTQVNLEVPVRD